MDAKLLSCISVTSERAQWEKALRPAEQDLGNWESIWQHDKHGRSSHPTPYTTYAAVMPFSMPVSPASRLSIYQPA